MKSVADALIEIGTEELPPKDLLKLGQAFANNIKDELKKANLQYQDMHFFATPRRLAVLIKKLADAQPNQEVERKGPAVDAAYDKANQPTKACIGFARSLGVKPEDLHRIKNPQGEWVGYVQFVQGKSCVVLLPRIVEQSLTSLPISKRMRWGDSDLQFVRPIHSIVLLYDDKLIDTVIFGVSTGQKTFGHRFLAPEWINLTRVDQYEKILETKGFVIADFEKRKQKIKSELDTSVKTIPVAASALINEPLLDEVTGLVEWPIAAFGSFDQDFLNLPEEVLISAMEDHQRYFPVVGVNKKLLPYFVLISNIPSKEPRRMTHGNERVLRARLSDAQFFYLTDKQESLSERLERLKGIVFQAKLGTLFDKSERLSQIAAFFAKKTGADKTLAAKAGLLAKTDLTTLMVGEFPELQGVMGYYYALHDGEPKEVALAIKEHYLPRFADDILPQSNISQIIAIADRMDNLVGAFGINQIPTGDKDPYGLRRAAIGILRILIENKISLDLREILEYIISIYSIKLENTNTVNAILDFMQERLKAWYTEQKVSVDIFASVAAVGISNPLDMHERIKAVQAFKKLTDAETLSIANKRVSNILAKYVDAIDAKTINPAIFENSAEKELAKALETKSKTVATLYEAGKYDEVLVELAKLRKPIDDFFDQVMVMTEDKPRRENRLLLLGKLRALFLQVADIALLQ